MQPNREQLGRVQSTEISFFSNLYASSVLGSAICGRHRYSQREAVRTSTENGERVGRQFIPDVLILVVAIDSDNQD